MEHLSEFISLLISIYRCWFLSWRHATQALLFFVEFFSLCCWAFNVGFYPRLTQTLLGFNTERDDRRLQWGQRVFFLMDSVVCSVLLLLLLFFVYCYNYCCYYLFKTERRTMQSGQTGFLSVVYRRKQTRKRRHIKKDFSANFCRIAPKLFRLGQNWNVAVWVEK